MKELSPVAGGGRERPLDPPMHLANGTLLVSMVKDTDVLTVWSHGSRNKYDPGKTSLVVHTLNRRVLWIGRKYFYVD